MRLVLCVLCVTLAASLSVPTIKYDPQTSLVTPPTPPALSSSPTTTTTTATPPAVEKVLPAGDAPGASKEASSKKEEVAKPNAEGKGDAATASDAEEKGEAVTTPNAIAKGGEAREKGPAPPAVELASKGKGFPVDLVYTWVNGTDPDWLKLRREAQSEDQGHIAADAQSDLRFRDHNEMLYSLRSVDKNAPWINHIYIMTCCRQKPSWLVESNKVTVVHHEEVFPTNANLPTFNSFAIESVTAKIPQLSEHFLMMNDDMMFGHPVKVGDFYDANGKPRVGFETTWPSMYKDAPPRDADAYLWAGHSVDYALDRNYGSETRHHMLHQAYPMTKTLFNRAEDVYQKEFQSTISHRFRNKADIMPHFLAAWVGIYEHKAIKLSEENTPSHRFVKMTDDLSKNAYDLESMLMDSPKLLCVGDMSDDKGAQKSVDDQYQKYLNSLFPDKSEFEKH